jgi:hypothetical protein
MKKNLLMALMAFCGLANAQITLTQSDVPVAGTVSIRANDATTVVSEGMSGANRAWDFASLKNNGTDTIRYINPSGAPGAAYFPSSNLVLKTYDPSISGYYYNFAKSSSASVDLIGASASYAGAPTHGFYTPAVRFFTFPLTYNSSYSGKSKLSLPIGVTGSPQFDSIKTVISITYSTLVDAYGSVVTPSGTYNSLRLRKISNTIDSTFYHYTSTKSWVWDNTAPGNSTDTTYQWWANGKSSYVAEVSLNGKSARTSGYLLSTSVSGIEALNNEAGLSVFPNPSNGNLTIRLNENTNATGIEFSNMLGEKVLSASLNGSVTKLDVSKFPKGIYIYQIKNDATVLKVGKVILE